MELYTYFRSSSAYRVRIALGLKNIGYDAHYIHLNRGGGEQFSESYAQLNPAHLVPVLLDIEPMTQSLAILEYIEERYPTPALLPNTPEDKAWVRSLALQIACEIHPLNNLRVLKYLENILSVSDADKKSWIAHWVELGFTALEVSLSSSSRTGLCCFGDSPTFADCCLVPQIFNARRFNISLSAYPTLQRINEHLIQLPAFAAASPENQDDAE